MKFRKFKQKSLNSFLLFGLCVAVLLIVVAFFHDNMLHEGYTSHAKQFSKHWNLAHDGNSVSMQYDNNNTINISDLQFKNSTINEINQKLSNLNQHAKYLAAQVQTKAKRGPTGYQGDPGAQGPPGKPGIQGAQGPQGTRGLLGTTGAVGPRGPAGQAFGGSFTIKPWGEKCPQDKLITSRYECERALRSKGMYDQRGRDLRVYQSSYSGYPTGCSYAQPYRDENYAKKIWGSNYKRYWAGNYNYKDYKYGRQGTTSYPGGQPSSWYVKYLQQRGLPADTWKKRYRSVCKA